MSRRRDRRGDHPIRAVRNLKPGVYRFTVTARNNVGAAAASPAIRVRIR